MLEHRRSPSPVFRSPQFGALHREECRTPGPGDYRDAAHIAWEEASTQAPSSAAASTTPPLGFGSRTDRACAISTPPIDEREVIPPDPLRRLNVMTRRALRLAHEGLHRPCSPAPGDYDPELPSGQLWRMQPEDEVFNSTEPRWRCSDLPEDPKTPGPAFYHPMPLRSPTPPAHDFSSSTVQRFTDPPIYFDVVWNLS